MNKTIRPFLIIVGSYFGYLLLQYVKLTDYIDYYWLAVSFGLGLSLNERRHRRSQGWLLKILITVLLMMSCLIKMDVIKIGFILPQSLLMIFYVWCGWAFFRE